MKYSIPRVALVGLGGYARVHLSQLQTLHDAGLCQLVAIAEPFPERHETIVAALKGQGIQLRDSLETLLCTDQTDAIFLATPIHLHASQTIAALEAGKHVYLEKPPCATLAEWQSMHEAQQRARKICAVGFQMQSHSAMRYLRRVLREGAIGEVQRIWASVRWRRGDDYYNRSPWAGKFELDGAEVFDGPATNALAHVVHGALALAACPSDGDEPLQNIRGFLKRARPIESYDSVYLECRTPQGCDIRLAFTHASAAHDEVVLHCEGEKGTASIDWRGVVHLNEQTLAFPCEPAMAAILDFMRALGDTNHKPAVTLQDTLPYMQLVNGARQNSGGAHDFAAELVQREEAGGFYAVAGLDEQMLAFNRDFKARPAVLTSA